MHIHARRRVKQSSVKQRTELPSTAFLNRFFEQILRTPLWCKDAKIKVCDTCAADLVPELPFATPVQRIWCHSRHLRHLCSGFSCQNRYLRHLCSGFWCQNQHLRHLCSGFATPVQRIWCQKQHLRHLCSGFWCQKRHVRHLCSGFATPVQWIWCQKQHLRHLCSGFELQPPRDAKLPKIAKIAKFLRTAAQTLNIYVFIVFCILQHADPSSPVGSWYSK